MEPVESAIKLINQLKLSLVDISGIKLLLLNYYYYLQL
jgi:hypothetical protein